MASTFDGEDDRQESARTGSTVNNGSFEPTRTTGSATQRFFFLAFLPRVWAFLYLALVLVMQFATSNLSLARVTLLFALVPLVTLNTKAENYSHIESGDYYRDHDERLLVAAYLIGFFLVGFLHFRFGESQQAVGMLGAAMAIAGVRLTKTPKETARNKERHAEPSTGRSATKTRAQRKRTDMSDADNSGESTVQSLVLKPLAIQWFNQLATLTILMGVLNLALIFGYAPNGKSSAVTLIVLMVTAFLIAALTPSVIPAMANANIPQKFWVRISIALALIAIPLASLIVALGTWPIGNGLASNFVFAFSVALVTVPMQLAWQATQNFVQAVVIFVMFLIDVFLVIWRQDATGQLFLIQLLFSLGLFGVFNYWGQVAQPNSGLSYHLGISRPEQTRSARQR